MKVNIVLQWMEIMSDSVDIPLEAGVWLGARPKQGSCTTEPMIVESLKASIFRGLERNYQKSWMHYRMASCPAISTCPFPEYSICIIQEFPPFFIPSPLHLLRMPLSSMFTVSKHYWRLSQNARRSLGPAHDWAFCLPAVDLIQTSDAQPTHLPALCTPLPSSNTMDSSTRTLPQSIPKSDQPSQDRINKQSASRGDWGRQRGLQRS